MGSCWPALPKRRRPWIATTTARWPDTQALLEAATIGFRPHQVVAVGTPGQEVAAVPLLAGRPAADGPSGEGKQAAAYVCREFTCQAPVSEPEGLKALLEPTS